MSSELYSVLLQITFFMVFGMILRLLNLLKQEDIDSIIKIIFSITLPFLLFVSAYSTNMSDILGPGIFVFSTGIILPFIGYAVGWLLLKMFNFEDAQEKVLKVNIAFSNTAFVGIPVCTALWGIQGTILAAIFDQGINLPLLTLGPYGYSNEFDWKLGIKFLLNPLVIAMFLGFILNILTFPLPTWVEMPITMLGSVTTPLALLLVGSLVQTTRIEKHLIKGVVFHILSRLLVFPLIVWLGFWFLGIRGQGAAVSVLLMAMPASIVATLYAKKYGANEDLASKGAFLTSILSIFSIPLFIVLSELII